MRVLVAGPTGVIGRALVPLLHSVGHEVVGLVRTPDRAAALEREGAEAVIADALDRDAVLSAMGAARPDAVVHLLTAIPAEIKPRRIDKDFAVTNRLRTEATRSLIDAAQQVGARRIITQSVGYLYAPAPGLAVETAPLLDPPKSYAPVLAALVELEALTVAAGGLALRVGQLYGPGSAFAADGSFTRLIKAGKLPIVGGSHSVFSFVQAHDVATAVVAALDRDVVGVVNVVDDDPVMAADWMRALAVMVGAPKPKSVPAWVGRLAAGGWGLAYFNELRGADNAKARVTLDWKPRYATWRDGFTRELA